MVVEFADTPFPAKLSVLAVEETVTPLSCVMMVLVALMESPLVMGVNVTPVPAVRVDAVAVGAMPLMYNICGGRQLSAMVPVPEGHVTKLMVKRLLTLRLVKASANGKQLDEMVDVHTPDMLKHCESKVPPETHATGPLKLVTLLVTFCTDSDVKLISW